MQSFGSSRHLDKNTNWGIYLIPIFLISQTDGTTPIVTTIMGLCAGEHQAILIQRLQYPRKYSAGTAQRDILVSVWQVWHMGTVHSILTRLLLVTFYWRPVLAFDIFLNYQQRKSWHFHQLLLTYCDLLKFIKVSHMFGGKCYLTTAAMNLGQRNIFRSMCPEFCLQGEGGRGRGHV